MKRIKKNLFNLSIDNKINIVGHFLTFISILLVFLTLNEMQIQRNNTYLPQIVAESLDTTVLNWERKQDITYLNDTETASSLYKDINLYILNIGVGVAKNLSFEWDDDNLIALADYINKNSNTYTVNINNEMLQIKSTGIENGLMISDRISKLNFLQSDANSKFTLTIPREYFICYKLILMDQLYSFPKLKLNISYEDIQGVKYTQTLTVNININSLISSKGDTSNDFTGNVEVKLIVE